MGAAVEEKGMEARMSKNESYDMFVDKFVPKLTTDDCYTPEPAQRQA